MENFEILAASFALRKGVADMTNEELCESASALISPDGPLVNMVDRKYLLTEGFESEFYTSITRAQEKGFNPKKKKHVDTARKVVMANVNIAEAIFRATLRIGAVKQEK